MSSTSSLLLTASAWTNDNVVKTNDKPQKRTPSMINTFNQFNADATDKPNDNETASDNDDNNDDDNVKIPLFREETPNTKKNNIENMSNIMNKLTAMNSDDGENGGLANFNPPPKPAIHVKKDMETQPNDLLPKIQKNVYNRGTPQTKQSNYVNNVSNGGNYSDYHKSYEGLTTSLGAKLNANYSNNTTLSDNHLMEKINYMIHLLEEQQHEKTNNVTEEFMLYCFLGVFMIYVVDSFTVAGKYVR